ncbi:HNH/endonuclease VII fold putative polymorphic toxin [Virgibacillus sp. 179-BFC.A HS]|uniref:HNH/endonuclease VII fold putative polymorphic toxin n=1 Tax=Tigheibacillus jepli TaxID=3035914 RepID=A0ABU5CEV2_9BACI|nr:HNH/endonuclease VII fold putative polymorphic toxin [Virgibacillus sp. 179-BFC.A HS]MDY0404821.1 HNH/endonuclease VII fold putative polymorphic toxin [Virgibacillus sp. 179-BFC.A HS]
MNKKGGDYKNYEYSSNPTHHGRYYEYDTPQGKRVIVEHINDGRLHTHAGNQKTVLIHLSMILRKKDTLIFMV